jgi:hypothetical protein
VDAFGPRGRDGHALILDEDGGRERHDRATVARARAAPARP